MSPTTAREGNLEEQVQRAKAGDRDALDAVLTQVSSPIYNLAMRMLWHPADAEDATQEILIRVAKHLGTFRAESAFTTWVYRVAANYLLDTRKHRAEREELTFARFADMLDEGLAPDEPSPAMQVENRLLLEEVKLGCTQGMLLCLNRDLRLVYILGHVFGLTSNEGAEVVGVSAATFRKRLSRARSRLHGFLAGHCGLVDAANPCRCARRLDHAVRIGRVDPERLLFAARPGELPSDGLVREGVGEMEQLYDAADILRGHPRYASPGVAADALRHLLDARQLRILAE